MQTGNIRDNRKRSFPRSRRICKRTDIEKILKCGQRFKYAHITVIYSPGVDKHNRYAILVGKRHGNAVFRNRIKRTLREIVRRNNPKEDGTAIDVLICPRGGSVMNLPAAKEELSEWLKNTVRY